ncbi:phosphotransferase [Micromonospora sp. U56]|uniref:phosphotransferase n=1 Tax=Micromonospora sp. U56 TaxID=2824900 RepID=UPI001B36250E|nr:phosphotransferase [Micromonospora sp. U56]MBQ0894572.1 phosphotransferase [Micromonospora sp. U56]
MTFDVGRWCKHHLGSAVEDVRLISGHLSRVFCVRLPEGREVIVKVRPYSPRLAGCATVQRALWRAGFPAPEPLAGPVVEEGLAVSAEACVPGGSLAPETDPVSRFAGLLARFITLAPRPATVGTFEPDLPWTAWNHALPGVWPVADDRDDDLNAAEHATAWLDETGARLRRRLSRFVRTPAGVRVVIGHGDWEAQNLRWNGDEPLVVHDWDSVTAAPEAVVVGLAASVWPCGMAPRAATVPESAAFLDAYQRAAGRAWSAGEIQASWAAGLWVYAFNTKKASLDGASWLAPDEAEQRLALAGA